MDTANGIEQVGGGGIAVEGIYDVCNVLAHVDFAVPFAGEQFRCAVDEVGGIDTVKQTFLVAGVELFKTCGEQTEGGEDEDLCGVLFLERPLAKGAQEREAFSRTDPVLLRENVSFKHLAFLLHFVQFCVCLEGVEPSFPASRGRLTLSPSQSTVSHSESSSRILKFFNQHFVYIII